jgi:alkylhydroperoxidase family enzyme
MARLPLIAEPEDDLTTEVFAGFRAEGRAPIALYQALAHSPRLLRAYSILARALRHEAETARSLRELTILRTAQLTSSEYEWVHHRRMATAAGVPEEKIRELADWRTSNAFDDRERAALRCAEEMHDLAVTESGFDELKASFRDSEIAEIVLLVAFYETVARVIQALGLEVEPEYRT